MEDIKKSIIVKNDQSKDVFMNKHSTIETFMKIKEMIVTIANANHKGNHNKIQQLIGNFYCLSKSYFYKERVVLFVLLDHLIRNHLKLNEKIKIQCQKITHLIECFIITFNQKLTNLKSQNLQKIYGQEMSNIINLKHKLTKYLGKIKQNQSSIICEYPFNKQQIELILNIFLDSWKQKQKQFVSNKLKSSFYSQVDEILSGKLQIQYENLPQKIIKLKIISEISTNQNLKYFLYKKINILLNKKIIAEIIETNQQKYVYFKTYSLTNQKVSREKRISQLFKQNDRSQLCQSENEDQLSQNSEIIQDEQFYRISSKISNSQRKNSFNSGEIPAQYCTQNPGRSQNYVQGFLRPQNSSIVLKTPHTISQIYQRSKSSQNNKNNNNTLYTSIDLFLKVQPQKFNQNRQKSCSTSRITKTTDSECKRSKLIGENAQENLNLNDREDQKKYEELLYIRLKDRKNNDNCLIK